MYDITYIHIIIHTHARLDANPTQIINEQKLQNEHNKSGSQKERENIWEKLY